ncbi:MAG: hypothetical protein JWO45_1235 [Spartobacteria bacterium]|nr:hypothetical protein [Spartobacteria bacterium]
MKLFLLGVPTLVCVVFVGAAADLPPPAEKAKSPNVRIRFDPGAVATKGFDHKGASGTSIGPPPGAMIHIGLGESFPVGDKSGQKLFDMSMAKGDDDNLVLEIKNDDTKQTLELKRDKAGSIVVAGVTYHILYPSVEVGRTGDEVPISNQVMLVVSKAP